MFKKHMTPINGKKGTLVKHAGKGAQEFQPPMQQGINNYAKATPMANPQPMPPDMPSLPGE